jgi:hypothetical protein
MTDGNFQPKNDAARIRARHVEWRQRFGDIVSAIMGQNVTAESTPLWLIEFFVQWDWIGDDRSANATLLSRVEALKRLKKVRKASDDILSALNDSVFRSFLEGPSFGRIDSGLPRLLEDLVSRINKSEALLVDEAGNAKAGRGKAEPPAYLSPKTACATMIAEVWHFIHGKEPGSRNQQAALAAQLLWMKTPNELPKKATNRPQIEEVPVDDRSWGGQPLNGWRRHFEEAKGPDALWRRKKFRHDLGARKKSDEYFARAGEDGAKSI